MKPLHTKWINELYDYMTSELSCKIISNCWKAAFITEGIEKRTKILGPLDPLFDINLLITEDNQTIIETLPTEDDIDFFDEGEWEFEGIPLNSTFYIINGDMV